MSEPAPKAARFRWWKLALLVFSGASVVALGLLIYINTDSFQSLVRRRLVAEVERISGGTAQIASIHTIPFRLQAEVRDITVHGREAASEIPLAHADGIVAQFKISSLLRSELAFHEVILEHPVVHVEFYPDGSSNFPTRNIVSTRIENPVEKLFALSINHFEIRHGQILWDDQSIPVDFAARDTSLRMDYSFLARRYEGRLLLGQVDTKLLKCRPFAWMTAMEFALGSDSAVISSLTWNSGRSHFSATGQVADFRHPRLQGPYDALFDLTEVASIARRRDLRGGVLELKGHGDWALNQFSSNGLLTLRDLSFQDDQISFSKASLSTGYSVTDQHLELSKLQGRVFGGSFDGEAELDQWLSPAQHVSAATRKALETAVISAAPAKKAPAQKAGRASPAAVQSGFVFIHLHDLSAEDIAVALNAPAHTFPSFHPTAAASGSVETRWKGTPEDAEAHFVLDLAPAASVARGQLAINAHAEGFYHGATDSLELAKFSLSTPSSRVLASGTLSSNSAVRLSASTSSLADWLPFISAVRGPALFPVALNGTASFNGGMSGSLSSPQIFGTLQANDFDVTVPPSARTRELQTHWDSLSTSLQLSFDSITLHNGKLERDGTSGQFDGAATLQHGHLTSESAFNVHAKVNDTNVAVLQALAGFDYPVTGTADVALQAGGTLSNPQADGQIHLTSASAYGETIRQFDSTFHLDHGELAFTDMHVFHDDSFITGSAAFNNSTKGFRFDLVGNNFDLAHIPQIPSGRLELEGRADFALKGSGTPEAPSIDGNVHLRSLTLDQEIMGDLYLQGATRGDQLQLTGNSHFQQGSLEVSGTVLLRDIYSSTLTVQMNQLNLDALLLAYFPGKLASNSSVGGSVTVRGPLRQPARWLADGDLTALSFDVANIKVQNQGPVRFSVAQQTLNFRQFHLVGEGTDLTAHGTVELSGAHALDLTADGRADPKLLSTFAPNFTASGLVTVDMTVAGTLSEPLPQGRIQVANASLAYAGLPSGLTEVNGSLLFTRDHINIDTLTARTGGGTVDLKGDATYLNRQLNFNFTGTAKDVRMRYPPGVSSTADAQLHWVGSRSSSTVSGDITVSKIAVTPGFDFSAYIDRSRQLSIVTAANSPLNNVKLDIHVQTAPELQMRTAIARLSGDADLRIRGSLGRPAVLGRIDVLEGQATFHGTRFTLERGDITFANPVAIEPQLDLQASTHVRDYDLNITITGTPDRGLNVNYRSEPPLPKSDIVALLALGRSSEQSAQLQEQGGQSAYSDEATAQIISQALNTTVSNRLQRLFGASNIKIDPQGLTTETNPISNGPQITIEQEFANHISLLYSTNVSQSSEQIIQGEYYINRSVSIVGTRDQNGVVSFDLRARTRKK
jgi:translocation and assembly module TamB